MDLRLASSVLSNRYRVYTHLEKVMAILLLLLMVIWLIEGKTAAMLMAVYTQTPRTKTANTANLRTKIAKWLIPG
jgi:hypothetical protein